MGLPTVHVTTNDPTKRNFTVLYSGESGTGKTTNGLSWPRPGVIYYESNLATLQKVPDVPYILGVEISTDTLEMSVLPALENGKATELFGREVSTIVVDSATELFGGLVKEMQGNKDRLTQGDFGRLLSRGESIIKRFCNLSLPSAKRPSYNFICTVHLRDITDDAGNLTKVRPAVMGQLKDTFPRMFDSIFVCKAEADATIVKQPDGSVKRTVDTRYVVWSRPQDKFHLAKDGVGGKSVGTLLPVGPGTYPELMKAWGLSAG